MSLTSLEFDTFRDVQSKSYSWTLDNHSILLGLVAGDMGFDTTQCTLEELLLHAQDNSPTQFQQALSPLVRHLVSCQALSSHDALFLLNPPFTAEACNVLTRSLWSISDKFYLPPEFDLFLEDLFPFSP